MSKPVKQMLIEEYRQRIGDARDMLLVDVSRLDAISSNRFRLALREKNISALTVRNRLARRALNDAGVTQLDPLLDGSSTLIWGGEDIIGLTREIAKWAREFDPLEIKGGAVEGNALSADAVDKLSKSPSRGELLGQIAAAILSPGRQLSAAMLAPGAQLASQVKSIADRESDESDGVNS